MATLYAQPWVADGASVISHLKSANSLSAFNYRFASPSGGALIIASSTDRIAGVIQNGGVGSAQPISLVVGGLTELKMGGACSYGETLIADASGRGIASAADNGNVGAIAMEKSSGAGDIIKVLVIAGFRY